MLLSALRALRIRKDLPGTQVEAETEARYESSLRRALGAGFEALYTRGAALDEHEMALLAFEQLEEIMADVDPATEPRSE